MEPTSNTTSSPALGYILKGYPRISETFISNEILQLERQGFTLTLFPMRQPREDFTHASVKQIRAQVHYLPTNLLQDFFRLIVPNVRLFLKSPRRYGQTFKLSLKRFMRSRKAATFKHFLQAGYLVEKHLTGKNRAHVEHLHGHFAHSPTSVTMFASLLSGIPYSFTAHAKDIYTSNREQLTEKMEKARFVVTCTRYNARYLEAMRKTSSPPIHCIYHGIDVSLFQSAGSRLECLPPYTLLTVARLTEKKGLPILYHALQLLKHQGVAFRHILIGDGDDKKEILQLIRDLSLTDCCTWLGTRTHAEVLTHFRESDLFLLSCRIADNGDRDGIPNVLVESLAMGVPALSTEVSAIPEIIEHRLTGLTVPPDDSKKLAEAALELLTDRELRRTVIEKGRLRIERDFDNLASTAKLADIFCRSAEN
ncbi:MAG: glycosyltransferase family 4 protein [Desulfopila sp.]|nr:glycosyltransferase family 4 protein [Desulfopila sp.]